MASSERYKKMSRVCVNVACGNTYVDDWLNYDYAPVSASVIKANLLETLPLESEVADVVYSSHFFEHIPRLAVDRFLNECFRVMKSGGKIRLVMPDLDELCREYLTRREVGEHEKANFVVLEILDQCVRSTPGGSLAGYYQEIASTNQTDMAGYIFERTGEPLTDFLPKQQIPLSRKILTTLAQPTKLIGRLERIYCQLLTSLLPNAFLQQNVSFTQIGERHAWIYDFYSLSKLLEAAGFVAIKKMDFDQSNIEGFPLFPLDLTDKGRPRKGSESMYIEATKP